MVATGGLPEMAEAVRRDRGHSLSSPSSPSQKEQHAVQSAQRVKTIRFEKKSENQHGLRLVIAADGRMIPDIFMVGKDRLVIDLPHIKSWPRIKAIPIQNRAIRQLRVGQHPDKLRLVLDLLFPVNYTVEQKGDILLIHLNPIPSSEGRPAVATSSQNIQGQKTPGRMSLDFVDADLVGAIRLIADVSQLNIEIDKNIKGKVTIKLSEVTWEEALSTVLNMHHLGYRRDGGVIRIATLEKMEAPINGNGAKEMLKPADLISRVYPLKYVSPREVVEVARKILSPVGRVAWDDSSRSITVTDTEVTLATVDQMVNLLDVPIPRVVIETRMIYATPSFQKALDLQREIRRKNPKAPQAVPPHDFAIDLPLAPYSEGNAPAMGRFKRGLSDLDQHIAEGVSQGTVHLVASPRTTVLNGQEAILELGEIPAAPTDSNKGVISGKLMLAVVPTILSEGGVQVQLKAASGSAVLLGVTETAWVTGTEMIVIDWSGQGMAWGVSQGSASRNSMISRLFKGAQKREPLIGPIVFLSPHTLK